MSGERLLLHFGVFEQRFLFVFLEQRRQQCYESADLLHGFLSAFAQWFTLQFQ